jgi:hypothetical protein
MPGWGGAVGADAADGDDATALAEVGGGGLDGAEHAPDVDRDDPVELLEREVLDGRGEGDGGVVDEDVQCAEVLCGAADCGLDGFMVRVVRLHGQGACRLGDGVGLVLGAGVGEGDLGAVGGQTAHDRGTDAPGPARDKGGLAVEGPYAGLSGAGGELGAHRGISNVFNTLLTNRTARLLYP